MSNEAVNWAFEQHCPSPGAKFVLVTLCDFADEQGFCYPSQKRLAKMTQQGERTVRMHLATLEEAGLIRREHRINPDGTFKSDGFHIQRQILPTANPADGKKQQEPAAKSASIQRQVLPPIHQGINHQIKPSKVVAVATPRVRLADFQPNEKQIADAIAYGVPEERVAFETEQWRDYHAEKGTPIKDFNASWRRWMRNSLTFNRGSPNGGGYLTAAEKAELAREREFGGHHGSDG